jgi:hypothetical protein
MEAEPIAERPLEQLLCHIFLPLLFRKTPAAQVLFPKSPLTNRYSRNSSPTSAAASTRAGYQVSPRPSSACGPPALYCRVREAHTPNG